MGHEYLIHALQSLKFPGSVIFWLVQHNESWHTYPTRTDRTYLPYR